MPSVTLTKAQMKAAADALRTNEPPEEKTVTTATHAKRPETVDGAFGDQLRMFDGYEITQAALALSGTARLYLADELHRAIVNDATMLDTARITVTIGGHTLELLGSLEGHGVKNTSKGLCEHLTIKVTSSLGESGHPIEDDDGVGD